MNPEPTSRMPRTQSRRSHIRAIARGGRGRYDQEHHVLGRTIAEAMVNGRRHVNSLSCTEGYRVAREFESRGAGEHVEKLAPTRMEMPKWVDQVSSMCMHRFATAWRRPSSSEDKQCSWVGGMFGVRVEQNLDWCRASDWEELLFVQGRRRRFATGGMVVKINRQWRKGVALAVLTMAAACATQAKKGVTAPPDNAAISVAVDRAAAAPTGSKSAAPPPSRG